MLLFYFPLGIPLQIRYSYLRKFRDTIKGLVFFFIDAEINNLVTIWSFSKKESLYFFTISTKCIPFSNLY